VKPSHTRRELLGLGAALVGTAACSGGGRTQGRGLEEEGEVFEPDQAWRPGGWFVHERVDASAVERGSLRARIEGAWRDLPVRELPERFLSWSLEGRLSKLDKLAERGFDPQDLDGPHNACVASWGGPRRDSFTSLNTAYKGVGFAPRPERLGEALAELEELSERLQRAGMGSALKMAHAMRHLGSLYRDSALWDRRRQVSLELFSSRDHATHSFANMLANPVVCLSFLSFPSFEIRAVPQLLHPADPQRSELERQLCAWTNAVHDLVHGGGGPRITCIYHVVELYDDSPGSEARGKRLL